MGWIERVQNSGGNTAAKNTELIARKIAKGIGFTISQLPNIEKKLEISSEYDTPVIQRVLQIVSVLSSGGCGEYGNRWKVLVCKEIMTKDKAIEKSKEFFEHVSKYQEGIIYLVRVESDALACVIAKENNIPEALRLPVCTLVAKENDNMVFMKEVSNLFRDLVVTEKWSD